MRGAGWNRVVALKRGTVRGLVAALAVAGVFLSGPVAAGGPTGGPAAGKGGAGRGGLIEFEADGEKVGAYLARPAGGGAPPGVVVIHEWWGLNDQIKGVADRFASIGYVALVPDLYRGKVPADAGLAHELMRGLSENRAIGIIKGAASYLRTIDGAKDRRIGTVGFCMGGRLSLAAAIRGVDVQATVVFYGSVETTEEAVAPIRTPVLGIFGADDRGIPVEDVKKFEAAMKAAGKEVTIIIYPELGHAFFNEQRPSYDKTMAMDAWYRTKDFLGKHLSPRPGGA
jgi:carboxymethylenebutenolidase